MPPFHTDYIIFHKKKYEKQIQIPFLMPMWHFLPLKRIMQILMSKTAGHLRKIYVCKQVTKDIRQKHTKISSYARFKKPNQCVRVID